MKTETIPCAEGGVALSKVVLGTGAFGSTTPEKTAFELMDSYYRLGGRTLDTARVYMTPRPGGASRSEQTIGRWLRATGLRREMTVVTKGGHPEIRSMGVSRLDNECIEYDLLTSLAVMDIDCADLFLLHRDDEQIPVGEIVDILDEKVRMGLARAVGASNWRLERILQANRYAAAHGRAPLAASQLRWNVGGPPAGRRADSTTCTMTREEYGGYLAAGLPVMAYSAQSGGFFYRYDAEKRAGKPPVAAPEMAARAELLMAVCDELGCGMAQLTLGYITSNRLGGCAVVGASRLEQLEQAMRSADYRVPAEVADRLLD